MNEWKQYMKLDDHPAVSGREVKEVVAFGKKCSKHAFPNPDRRGCPDRDRLRAMAYRDPNLKLEDIPIAHVVRCSPCFREYLHFRRTSLFLRGLQLTAAPLIVAAVLVTSAWFVMIHTSKREPNLSQHPSEQQLRPESGQNPQVELRVPPLQMTIDLADFSPMRGDEKEAAPKTVRLPQRNLQITFQMPLGMEVGEYLFELKDASGNVYAHTRAPGHLTDGTTMVNVDLDLTGVPRGTAVLMIRPPSLGWRNFPSIIE
jgi:hypothetical protein